MKKTALKIEGLTKRFGTFTAVDRIDLEIALGEIFGFLGPNGSGKTTTIRMLCGLLSPSEGQGSILGMDISNEGERIRHKIGYMSQKFSLYSDLTVLENLKFYAGMYNLGSKKSSYRIEELMDFFRMKGLQNEMTSSLAAGIRQKLALACSIVHKPSLLFLDEPTSGVDPAGRRNFWKVIYALAEQGTTIMVTTHFMDEAEHCDNLGLIYSGILLAYGTPGEMKKAIPGNLFSIRTEDPFFLLETLKSRNSGIMDAYIYGRSLRILSYSETLSIPGEMAFEKIDPSLQDVFVYHVREGEKRNAIRAGKR